MEIPKKRWDSNNSISIKTTHNIDCFLAEYIKICKKYNICFSHEDCHGAFEIEKLDDHCIKWVLNAHDNTKDLTPENKAIEDERIRLSEEKEIELKKQLNSPLDYDAHPEWKESQKLFEKEAKKKIMDIEIF